MKEQFPSLIKQDPDKKNVIRELSSCITERYNGFHIVRIEFVKKLIQKFVPIDIVYKPVRKCTEIINCYFSNKLNLTFRSTFSENTKIRHGTDFQCYFCSNYYGRKDKFNRHLDCCTGRPGYDYNFNTQSLVTFEENLKYKEDVALTAYIYFKITVSTDKCLDPESKKMFVVSYVIIFGFHPELNIDRVIIERSFGCSEHSLTSLNYLTINQLQYKDKKTLLQLRDCTINVARKKNKLAVAEMFSTEVKFAGYCLIKWFNKNFKFKNLELSNNVKRKYEVENPIDRQTDTVIFANFHLKLTQRF